MQPLCQVQSTVPGLFLFFGTVKHTHCVAADSCDDFETVHVESFLSLEPVDDALELGFELAGEGLDWLKSSPAVVVN